MYEHHDTLFRGSQGSKVPWLPLEIPPSSIAISSLAKVPLFIEETPSQKVSTWALWLASAEKGRKVAPLHRGEL